MNESDHALIRAVMQELEQARQPDYRQHDVMTRLLWAQHLLATLLRQMQDD